MRGDQEICHLLFKAPFSVAGAQSRDVSPLVSHGRGDPQQWGGSQPQAQESFKGGQQDLTYHLLSFRTAPVCFSITLANFRRLWGALPTPSQHPWDAGVFHGPFLQHTFLNWRSHSSAPGVNSLQVPQPPKTMAIQATSCHKKLLSLSCSSPHLQDPFWQN